MAAREPVTVRLLGVDIDFHHPRGRDLALAPEVEDRYSLEHDDAPIFRRNRDGAEVTPAEILEMVLTEQDKYVADWFPEGEQMAMVPVGLPPGVLSMETEEGRVDVRGIRFMVQAVFDDFDA